LSSIIETLATAHDEHVSPQRAAIYITTLRGRRYSEEELTTAGRELLITSRRFPAIADFVEAIEGKQPTLDSRLAAEASRQWSLLTSHDRSEKPARLASRVCKDVVGTVNPGKDLQFRDMNFMRRPFVEEYVRRRKAEEGEARECRINEISSTGRDIAGMLGGSE